MGRTPRERPCELTESWPDVAGERARQFAVNLAEAIEGKSLRSVAGMAGVDEGTLRRVLSGNSWPDLRTIARVEASLGRRLYSSSSCLDWMLITRHREEPDADHGLRRDEQPVSLLKLIDCRLGYEMR
jgi:transcriptional regulator with XRE-family HTH domain